MEKEKRNRKEKNKRKEEKEEKMQGRTEGKIEYGCLFDNKNPVIYPILESLHSCVFLEQLQTTALHNFHDNKYS